MPDRSLPNLILTGTPGTGKTFHAEQLAEASSSAGLSLRHINVGDVVKEHGCHTGWNDEWSSYDVDDDKLLDHLEPVLEGGGCIVDWHSCEIFPERLVDLVIVLRSDHSKLWSRLEGRGYDLAKIQENNEAEIMQTVLEEARSAYVPEIVVELRSDTPDDVDANLDRVLSWIRQWRRDQGVETPPSARAVDQPER